MLKGLLRKTPGKRLTADEIVEHEWLKMDPAEVQEAQNLQREQERKEEEARKENGEAQMKFPEQNDEVKEGKEEAKVKEIYINILA